MLISSATSTPSAISVASLSRSSTSRVSNFGNLEISSKISLRGFRARVSSKAVVKVKAMAELVEDKESIKNVQNIIRLKKSSSEIDDNDNVGHSLTFIDVRSEKGQFYGFISLISSITVELMFYCNIRVQFSFWEKVVKNRSISVF